ncbi:MAG: hypothetical protein ACKODK_11840 [Opitutaceae bacterium]|jgi:hypothetical protein
MNDSRTDSTDVKLERLIGKATAGLPTRTAPASLEGRVLAAIASAGTSPVRAQGFAVWPVAVRWLVLSALTAIAAAVLIALSDAGPDGTAWVRTLVPRGGTALWEALRATWEASGGALALLGRSIPATWWYLAAAAFACWYAGVIGLGLTAYRLLRTRD